MATSFKRVISHPDELGDLATKEIGTEDANVLAIEDGPTVLASTATEDTAPAVVEVDDHMEKNPSVQMRFQAASSNVSLPSSLSGSSTGLFVDFHDEQITHDTQRNEAHLFRVDSTKSVGSGSGAWGWFQDVHGAEKNNSFKKKVPSRIIDTSHESMDDGKLGAAALNLSILLFAKLVVTRSPQLFP